MTGGKTLRIGGASGFWGDSVIALPQLLRDETLDFIVFDYLAEVTMSILARARRADPALGYVADFVDRLTPYLPILAARGVRIVSNAGGINPQACAKLIEERISAAGLSLRVGVVTGDDLLPRVDELRGAKEMFSGGTMPERFLSLNAYLGAMPIAAALDAGADIVITGRCVDSAMVLGPCIHTFGWSDTDYDRLSGGSLAGHILECGAQASGGLFTDWDTTGDWDDIGYPIARIGPNGDFLVTKVPGTGGLVSRGTVSEQLVYEIGDPRAYLLPDVTCDWSEVSIDTVGPDLVRVSGARGYPPPKTLKASGTWQDGYRVGAIWTIIGDAAVQKAEKIGQAVIKRVARLLEQAGKPNFSEVSVEVIGSESSYGSSSRARDAREVILKIAAKHPDRDPLALLVAEYTSAGTSMAPGFTGFGGNRPKVAPVVRLFSMQVSRTIPEITVAVAGESRGLAMSVPEAMTRTAAPPMAHAQAPAMASTRQVPLKQLAWGRSGDKGNHANIGIIARKPEYLPYLREALDEGTVAGHFAHYAPSRVERFDLPGIGGLNFLLHDILGGGGIASLRNDPQGKGYAQILLALQVSIPRDLQLD